MNYFEFHLGDYSAATSHLSWDEDMAYERLIRAYYHHEKPIPLEISAACRLARATTPAQRKAVEIVLSEFFFQADDGWHQKRCDEEIARYMDKQSKAKRSANARWKTKPADTERNANASAEALPTDDERNADAMRTHSEGNALQTPDTRHQAPDKEREGATATVAARGARLSTDWVLPEDWSNWARTERPDLDPAKVAERFADHWAAKPGADGRKLDWLATWRNWVRAERAPAGAAGKPTETAYARSMREKYEILCPDIAARPPGSALRSVVNFDQEIADVAARRLG